MVDASVVLVVGAGVVGLATARRLALEGQAVILIGQNSSFRMETSSRNSEVIHAGIYYPKGSYGRGCWCVVLPKSCWRRTRHRAGWCAAR